ncbi:MAG: glycosyltransferase family 39 protein [bacterium]|jgi:4-amino-4-deoxy-L-arabinose transferase-like glycosyltransferase|nr:glycosyltransferase family 39 protein [candidate division KSB1 bacterium]MDH7558835.1 glycosyltransferase family 39 protein [bacterium]
MPRTVRQLLADRVFVVISLLALAARLLFVASLENRLYWPIDENAYDHLARSLVAGNGYVDEQGRATAYRPVGYPAFLALIYLLFGRSLAAVRIVQSVLTTALVGVVYLLALRLFDRRVARIAAGICALYPYFVYVAGVLYSEALCVFLLAYAVYRFIRACDEPRTLRFVGLGTLLGALLLIRPNLLAALPFFVAWYCWVPGVRRRMLAWMAALSLLVAIATIAPWVARNYVRLGAFTLTTNGGRNFWLGNNPAATADTGNEVALPPDLAQRLDQASSEVERDRIYYATGLAFIRQQPVRFLRLAASKAVAFWRLYPVPSTGFKQNERLSKVASIVTFGPLLGLAILGLIASWRRSPRENLAFLCLFIGFDVAHALYIAIVRLRLPLDVFLMPFAGFGVVWLVQRWRAAGGTKPGAEQVKSAEVKWEATAYRR